MASTISPLAWLQSLHPTSGERCCLRVHAPRQTPLELLAALAPREHHSSITALVMTIHDVIFHLSSASIPSRIALTSSVAAECCDRYSRTLPLRPLSTSSSPLDISELSICVALSLSFQRWETACLKGSEEIGGQRCASHLISATLSPGCDLSQLF